LLEKVETFSKNADHLKNDVDFLCEVLEDKKKEALFRKKIGYNDEQLLDQISSK